jgi:hypothetical protein
MSKNPTTDSPLFSRSPSNSSCGVLVLLALHPLPERTDSHGVESVCLGPVAGMFNLFLSLSFCRHSLPYFTTDDFSPEASFRSHFELARTVYHPGEQSSLCLVVTATDLPKGFIIKVKKMLECICVNCRKLKADIMSLRSPLSSTRFALPPP